MGRGKLSERDMHLPEEMEQMFKRLDDHLSDTEKIHQVTDITSESLSTPGVYGSMI